MFIIFHTNYTYYIPLYTFILPYITSLFLNKLFTNISGPMGPEIRALKGHLKGPYGRWAHRAHRALKALEGT